MTTITSDWAPQLVLNDCLRRLYPGDHIATLPAPAGVNRTCDDFMRYTCQLNPYLQHHMVCYVQTQLYTRASALIKNFANIFGMGSSPLLKFGHQSLSFKLYDGVIYALMYRATIDLPRSDANIIMDSLLSYLNSDRINIKSNIRAGDYLNYVFNQFPNQMSDLVYFCDIYAVNTELGFSLYDYDVQTLDLWYNIEPTIQNLDDWLNSDTPSTDDDAPVLPITPLLLPMVSP